MSTLVSLFDQIQRFKRLPGEHAMKDPENRLTFDQADALAYRLSGEFVAGVGDHLIQERKGVAHAAFSRASD